MSERKPLRAIVIQVDGTYEVVEFKREDELRLLQSSVGGYVEVVSSPDGKLNFWINEEGKLTGLPINRTATLALYAVYPAFRGFDVLAGPVVITGGVDQHGNTKSVTKNCFPKTDSVLVNRLAESL